MVAQEASRFVGLIVPPVVRKNIARKVRQEGDCKIWTGYTQDNGYGLVHIDHRPFLVHRVVYYMVHGEYEGLVLHSCDRRNCIEAEHLHEGDHEMNTREAVERGRHWAPTGVAHHATHLTEDDIRYIRSMRREMQQKELAAKFAVAQSAIAKIQLRITWAHVV